MRILAAIALAAGSTFAVAAPAAADAPPYCAVTSQGYVCAITDRCAVGGTGRMYQLCVFWP